MNKQEILDRINRAEAQCAPVFQMIDQTETTNTRRVLDCFKRHGVQVRHFSPSNGYGYDDIGRDTLESIFADLFGAEAAIVRPHIVSGTAALSLALSGMLRPGDHVLCAAGLPYDTMQTVLGLAGNAPGNLSEWGISCTVVPLCENGLPDHAQIRSDIRENTRLVLVQRSRGYDWRPSLTLDEISQITDAVKQVKPDAAVMVDNCYGEFTGTAEPCHLGADVSVGSLIKNPGGGIAPTGGYILGRRDLIDRIAARMTAPGIGREEGSYAASYRPFYQGLFMAPHTVSQALKTAVLSAAVFESLGLETSPAWDAQRSDIIQAVRLRDGEKLRAFCQAVQASSPVDATAVPEPWDMPGYESPVIMAAGTFVSCASVELSADGPMREPYTVYQQGALTYAHGRIALQSVLELMADRGLL